MSEFTTLGNALGNMKSQIQKEAQRYERKVAQASLEKDPVKAFGNFKRAVFEVCSTEVKNEHLKTFELEELTESVLKIRIGTELNYEFIQQNMKGAFQSLFNTYLAHLAPRMGFVLNKPKRPYLQRVESQTALSAFLRKTDRQDLVNPGMNVTAMELIGMLCSHFNSKRKSAQSVMKEFDGKRKRVFRFSTSNSGFAASRNPPVQDKRTIKDHIDRLLEIGVLLEQSDGHRRSRAHTFWIEFNPDIIRFK